MYGRGYRVSIEISFGGWGGVWVVVFFFKQKTAYEIGTGDWSSDVCSSDLACAWFPQLRCARRGPSAAA